MLSLLGHRVWVKANWPPSSHRKWRPPYTNVLGQSIKGIGDLNALLLAADDKDIIHIDECHELDKQFQTALYLAVDKRTIFANSAKRSPEAIPISEFSLLLSTTDEYELLAPLRDRMKLTLRFEYYSRRRTCLMLRHRCKALNWPVDEKVLPLIAQRCRGVPRLALRLLQSCRRVCRSEGEKAIVPIHFDRAVALEQLDGLGLGPLERKYLAILKDGPSRLNVIASVLGTANSHRIRSHGKLFDSCGADRQEQGWPAGTDCQGPRTRLMVGK